VCVPCGLALPPLARPTAIYEQLDFIETLLLGLQCRREVIVLGANIGEMPLFRQIMPESNRSTISIGNFKRCCHPTHFRTNILIERLQVTAKTKEWENAQYTPRIR
jgi:hypothetical protein